MTSTDTGRLTKKLEEQLQFVRRSCDAYDQGAEEESLRIATSLRVVFHQTGASTSLITHRGFEREKNAFRTMISRLAARARRESRKNSPGQADFACFYASVEAG